MNVFTYQGTYLVGREINGIIKTILLLVNDYYNYPNIYGLIMIFNYV